SAFATGGRVITASYAGGGGHQASSGTTLVSVALLASTNGCVASGHGVITAANGDQASFAMIAFASPPRGIEIYRTQAFRVRSHTVGAVTCSADETRASVFGEATLGSAETVKYRVDVLRAKSPRYRIRLGNGYDSGTQPLHRGDIRIFIRR